MFRIITFLIIVSSFVFASQLNLSNGEIKAHTEVFGDSTIDPKTSFISSNLTIKNDDISTIKGSISINPLDLISDNESRDKNMYETLNAKVFKKISFDIKNISKQGDIFKITGILNLHGVKKDLTIDSKIVYKKDLIFLSSKFTIKMTDYDITPPVLLFLKVRNEVDIDVQLELKRDK